MLQISEASSRYGDVQVLKGVSLAVGPGEIISLIGANGAGKTTTINLISGLTRLQSGEIRFMGERIDRMAPHDIVGMGLVQVPEGRQVFPSLTVVENLEMGAFLPHARRQLPQNLKRVYDLFPVLAERRQQAAGSLSGGEQQMLAISRGLMSCPKLLMLDEPSLGLAPIVVKGIFQIIAGIKAVGIPILLVEQNVYYALSIAQRVYLLENGQVALQGTGRELLSNPHVKTAYLGV
jgi:branched-chain amino acid transport system ATP-binding protein